MLCFFLTVKTIFNCFKWEFAAETSRCDRNTSEPLLRGQAQANSVSFSSQASSRINHHHELALSPQLDHYQRLENGLRIPIRLETEWESEFPFRLRKLEIISGRGISAHSIVSTSKPLCSSPLSSLITLRSFPINLAAIDIAQFITR